MRENEILKYHEDTTAKRQISKSDIDFLSDLQREMNTQDTLGQADPRYWAIVGSEREYGVSDGLTMITDKDTDKQYTELKDIVPLIQEYLDEWNKGAKAVYKENRWIDIISGGIVDETFFDMNDAAEWLSDHGADIEIGTYDDRWKVYDGTLFLTHKEALSHLKKNDYHYSEDAHTFAMTAWRSPQVKQLWKLLQEIDWAALKQIAKDE